MRERIHRYQDYRINQLSKFINLIFTLSTILIGITSKNSTGDTKSRCLEYLLGTVILIIFTHIFRFKNFSAAEKREKAKMLMQENIYKTEIKFYEKATYITMTLALACFLLAVNEFI